MIDLDELERLEREATPGPWAGGNAFDVFTDDDAARRGEPGTHIAHTDPSQDKEFDKGRADRNLIVALRNAAPAMIAELRTLRVRVAELERDLQRDEPRAALAAILRELDALMRESEGVAGLHLNGDVATWEELETTWLSIEAVREWAAKFERDARLGARVREIASQHDEHHDLYGFTRAVMRAMEEIDKEIEEAAR